MTSEKFLEEKNKKRYIRTQYGEDWNIQNSSKNIYNKVPHPPTSTGYIGRIHGLKHDIDFYKQRRDKKEQSAKDKIVKSAQEVKTERNKAVIRATPIGTSTLENVLRS